MTDGLKRALRLFGDQFANRLYEWPNAGSTAEANELTDLRASALLLGAQLGLDEPGTKQRVAAKAQRHFDDLDATDLARIVRAMAGALGKRAA